MFLIWRFCLNSGSSGQSYLISLTVVHQTSSDPGPNSGTNGQPVRCLEPFQWVEEIWNQRVDYPHHGWSTPKHFYSCPLLPPIVWLWHTQWFISYTNSTKLINFYIKVTRKVERHTETEGNKNNTSNLNQWINVDINRFCKSRFK